MVFGFLSLSLCTSVGRYFYATEQWRKPEGHYPNFTIMIDKQHKNSTYINLFILTRARFGLKEDHLQGVFIVE